MISISGKKWQENKVNNNLVEKLQQDKNFSKILSKIIVSRNFDDEEIYLIENNLELSNIFQNNSDFKDSIRILEKSIKNKENICILGDYDVDGSAATALLVRFFDYIHHPFFFYIPDREKDGYGASKELLKKLITKKPKLIIMVDCGSTSIEAINYLNYNNIKSIVIDHHEINKPYPKADVIINPKKNNGYIEYSYFCATTLTFFFLEMFSRKIKCKINLRKYLIYVVLATVCDVMPLRKINRLISILAVKDFDIRNNNAFNELYNLSNKKNKISIDDLGFLIGPILNSGGRLGKSNYAVELLSSNDKRIIFKRSTELINLNNKRKKIESIIMDNIDFHKLEKDNDDVIVYYSSNINEGLIGIIASRLKDYFNKPSIVITNSNNILKSSARSIHGYNIGKAVKNAIDQKLLLTGGGHDMAAGFTLKKENLEIFKRFINNDFSINSLNIDYSSKYDAEISSTALNENFFNDIKKIEPFGAGNPLPTFLFKDLKVIKSKIVNSKHVSCILKSKLGKTINSISFYTSNNKIGEHLLNYKKNFNVVGQINENFHNNKKKLQLIIKDLVL